MQTLQFQTFVNILVSLLLNAVLPLAVAAGVAFVAKTVREMSVSAGSQKWYALTEIARTVVRAAEQAGLAELIKNTGEGKKEWAIAQAKAFLAIHGYGAIDVDAIAAAIEAAVHEMNAQLPVTLSPLVQLADRFDPYSSTSSFPSPSETAPPE